MSDVKDRQGQVSALTIAPNPATDEVMIEWSNEPGAGEAELTVYDQMGRQVMQESLRQSPCRVNTLQLVAGIYYAVVRDVHGVVKSSVLVVGKK